jgi:hypothetical protein
MMLPLGAAILGNFCEAFPSIQFTGRAAARNKTFITANPTALGSLKKLVIPLLPYPSRWTSQRLPISSRRQEMLSFKHTTLGLPIGPRSQWLWQTLQRPFPESLTSFLKGT